MSASTVYVLGLWVLIHIDLSICASDDPTSLVTSTVIDRSTVAGASPSDTVELVDHNHGDVIPLRLGRMPGCATQPVPSRFTEWQEDIAGSYVTVEWTYGNVSRIT